MVGMDHVDLPHDLLVLLEKLCPSRLEPVAVDCEQLALLANRQLGVISLGSWSFAEVDPQLFALFFEEFLFDDQLPDFSLQLHLARLLSRQFPGDLALALEDLVNARLQFLFSGADLWRGHFVFPGYLVDRAQALEGLERNACFEFGTQVPSFSFHRFCSWWFSPPRTASIHQQASGSVWRHHFTERILAGRAVIL